MNPIEHVWDQIGRELETLDPRPANLQELSVAISQIWNAIPQEKIRRLIRSMPRRIQAVARARGGHTRY